MIKEMEIHFQDLLLSIQGLIAKRCEEKRCPVERLAMVQHYGFVDRNSESPAPAAPPAGSGAGGTTGSCGSAGRASEQANTAPEKEKAPVCRSDLTYASKSDAFLPTEADMQ